ncbi:thioesterase II family protein [Micromonospora endolithica]|uniref:Thioesterase n=1 Tax=Micromonospora endolithica TaxID=230091 RepID=A0A3A9ZJ94_9ACTN|nr:alpha/beta fold hydrolase [Micromonospora endolithica]RKN47497.1 thioesterase [Micromonospora endolithica]TWJ21132.1 surfactin synthase thioesterase subunit [Micromonospora endolithica]
MTTAPHLDGRWLRRIQPRAATVRLVCFPHAGGSAGYFAALAERLPGVEVLAVQYPGRQDRLHEGCAPTLAGLADDLAGVLREADRGPWAFFGHSMGAIVAFEVARRLTGRPAPVHLFASGYQAPSRLRGGSVHRGEDDDVLAELRTAGGTDPQWLADPALRALLLPTVRGDYRVVETHPRSRATVDCPITMLMGTDDPHTTPGEAAAWAEHTTGAFDLRVFEGGHFFLDRRVAELGSLITAALTDG